MNETICPDGAAAVPWATGEPLPVPDTSMPPGREKAPPTAVGLLKDAVKGARLADGAAPAVQRLGESVAAAGETLHAKTDRLRATRDEWVEGVRSTVRGNPLASVAAAFALGVLIARSPAENLRQGSP